LKSSAIFTNETIAENQEKRHNAGLSTGHVVCLKCGS